jgi:tetratricopeptide (TPR) repeat protein
LIIVAAHHDALDRGLTTAAAQREGDDVTIVVLLVVVAVAAAQAGLTLLGRRVERPRWLAVPPRVALGAAVAAVLGALVVALALGAPSELSDRWDEFRSRDAADPRTAARGTEILDISSSGRYQFWQSALDANETDPLIGIGAGTFEFWWAREGSLAIFARDAHSLYIEALAELGIVGFVLVLAFVAGVLIVGAGRLLRAPPELRLGLAVAVAGCAVFAAAATVDWMWELGVLPVSFMLLAGVAVAGRDSERAGRRAPAGGWFRSHWLPRIAVGALALAALVLIAIPLAGGAAIDQSRADARSGDLEGALSQARRAEDLQPYAATPLLQEAVVLERAGDLDAAARAAREATERESTNWRTWLTLSRLEALRGNSRLAVTAYRHAAGLNPRFLM